MGVGRRTRIVVHPLSIQQVVLVLLLIYSVSLPFVVVSHLDTQWIAVLVDFLAVSTYWTIDEVRC